MRVLIVMVVFIFFTTCNNKNDKKIAKSDTQHDKPHIDKIAKIPIKNVKKITFEYKKLSYTRNLYYSKIENIDLAISDTWKNRSIRDSLLSVDDTISIPKYEKDVIYLNRQKFLIDSILKIDMKGTFLPAVVGCHYFEFENSKFIVLYLIDKMQNHSAFSKSVLLLFNITNQYSYKLVNTLDFYQQITNNEPYRFGDFDGDGHLDMINWTFAKKDTLIIQAILKK